MRVQTRAAELSGGGVLVPTMGALHQGHVSLIQLARQCAPGPVVVSVFVNPTQFNERSDFDRYPRNLDRDASVAQGAGADIVFAPGVDEVYPPESPVPVPMLPDVATRPGLEDAGRPGHFAGVCQVVSRLFDLCRPTHAVFGEKDWQQLQVVRAMVASQHRDVTIVPHPIVREPDGLAMSSRNALLSPEARRQALVLRRALLEAAQASTPEAGEAVMRRILDRPGVETQYAVVRDAEALEQWQPGRPGRALVCARVGGVRLLDNDAWSPSLGR
ncbi:MAG: pantoate--beta-alanine ligase [Leptolyngbya sp. PLA3]|nr:MAG: pantoate--beta-alanine ligase [Cyanobacteria bacterium CYA]MCE7967958.1 pantoate--beta-alanine ligase [Leptolyngbya sp. PL-A3]